MKYTIYQATMQEPVGQSFIFMDYQFACRKVSDFPHNWESHYRKVYEDESNVDVTDLVVLEHLFHVFNSTRPLGFNGRSLSVSDVVVFEDSSGRRTYYCDPFGWQEVK